MIKQVNTWPVTTESIMRDPLFRQGFDEVRCGQSFDWRVDSWEYERGRLFAHVAPLDMTLFTNKKLNPKAIALFNAALRRGLII
jgi:hypothetical protein